MWVTSEDCIAVKKVKRKLQEDTSNLHTRIQRYFGADVRLSSYAIPQSAIPRKQRILKAIPTEEQLKLPPITMSRQQASL